MRSEPWCVNRVTHSHSFRQNCKARTRLSALLFWLGRGQLTDSDILEPNLGAMVLQQDVALYFIAKPRRVFELAGCDRRLLGFASAGIGQYFRAIEPVLDLISLNDDF